MSVPVLGLASSPVVQLGQWSVLKVIQSDLLGLCLTCGGSMGERASRAAGVVGRELPVGFCLLYSMNELYYHLF